MTRRIVIRKSPRQFPERFVEHDCNRVREIKTAHRWEDRDSKQALCFLRAFADESWKPRALTPKHEKIAHIKRNIRVEPLSVRAAIPDLRITTRFMRPLEEAFVARVLDEAHLFPVVNSRAPHVVVVERESKLSHKMQR